MILNCITSLTANRPSPVTKEKSSKASIKTANSQVPFSSCLWNWRSPTFLHAASYKSTPSTRTMTLMGLPKQYFGESSRDRYAFMMYEAISMLHRYGFHTDIPFYHPSKRHSINRKYHQRVPGILGFLLDDIDTTTRISIFDYTNALVAYLGFTTYEQPWLKVVCVVPASSDAVQRLRRVLSKDFLLADLFHESTQTMIAITSTPYGNSETEISTPQAKIAVKMTTGLVTGDPGRSTEMAETLTKFTFTTKDGRILCRAIWSYSCEKLDTAGPALEDLDVITAETDPHNLLGVMLTSMEDTTTGIFAPMVGFRIRMASSIEHPGFLQWMAQRGYVESKQDGFGRCKAFAMF